jgi:hypothetical protein
LLDGQPARLGLGLEGGFFLRREDESDGHGGDLMTSG